MKNQKMTDAYKNAMGTVFLLAGAFFICSTLLSMRTVLADPIAPVTATRSQVSPARAAARNTTKTRSSVARSTTTRAVATPRDSAAGARNIRTRSVRVRTTDGASQEVQQAVRNDIKTRSVSQRRGGTGATRNTQRVVARTATTPSRVSLVGTGMRATTGTSTSNATVSYLSTKVYSNNYSNIIDSSTGLISADAYSDCLEGYYTCMDEICTARSDTKGRCSCAGRATNFLAAETALEKANEELINLSGQLALLVATKGKDVSEAFKLTDAEKVMNCVSYKENVLTGNQTAADWYQEHPTWNSSNAKQTSGIPEYCQESGNSFGFDISSINGSGSDILASLKAWADAKDLAKEYTVNDSDNLLSQYGAVAGVVNGLSGVTTTDIDEAKLDGLANKWGYELFEYAHNNVCGRVLDACFNGIYEACGTPPSGVDSAGHKIGKCANSASTSCPYNYNSAIAVKVSGDGSGEVTLNERGSTGSSTTTSATCFGYTSASGDPYATLRGPVADARRSIMQKYLLDANAACDTYGTALKNTAQNINYQKIAAEQALRQKRMEFYNAEQEKLQKDTVAAIENFNECISEIWDCYNENSDQDTWSGARIKTYCAQVSNVPHCYETMICTPTQITRTIVDVPDSTMCKFDASEEVNTCRNIVTLNEILYGAAPQVSTDSIASMIDILSGKVSNSSSEINSTYLREACLRMALNCVPGIDDEQGNTDDECLRKWKKPVKESSGN